jgi:hypothetical protein
MSSWRTLAVGSRILSAAGRIDFPFLDTLGVLSPRVKIATDARHVHGPPWHARQRGFFAFSSRCLFFWKKKSNSHSPISRFAFSCSVFSLRLSCSSDSP